ncbi:helicase [Arachnia propionica]|uniref:Helicase n=2 Tax=Arachnia propionica TaxID=1750 RepID=A0A3P1T772_9ACTN|nr:helicase [Arachnia propionica]
MVSYFEHDPLLRDTYENVSRWNDWAHRAGTADVGIDLVAQHRATGEWTAIQCKFYSRAQVLQKKDIDSFFTASGKRWDGVGFSNRIIISTTDLWSRHAEEALSDQQIPVTRIGLEQLQSSPIDWVFADRARITVDLRPARRYRTRPHQDLAITKILAGFAEHDRGQWISACGTGKTFTSLKLAEQLAEAEGGSLRVLFLAPSIQLVAQTLREWSAQAELDLRATVVCSDTKASRAAEDIALHDLPLPATTDPTELHRRLTAGRRGAGLTVTFSTYQSAAVVSKAQDLGAPEFDLILCDEAHRTTGVTLAGTTESDFVRVHDPQYLKGRRRLYMTATPRLFSDAVKDRAEAHSAELTSMDDHTRFGPVFHRLGFGEAVEQDLLTDYKVLVLVVSEEQMAAPMQQMQAGQELEIPLDDAARIMGCWNSLAKRSATGDPSSSFPPDATPMKRAVAFLENIRSSQQVARVFDDVVTATAGAEEARLLSCQARHVDGTMNALVRARELGWLKADVPDGECRILTNARCLSEGVDVPALDAVMFLSPRSSAVDVVQSVGRVMRKAPGKEFGYIILPVAVPAGVAPEQALSDNKRFKVVWEVLNALRAHDDRFESVIQSIELNGGKDPSGTVIVDTSGAASGAAQLPLFALEQWRDAIYSRIVSRVGSREYWDRWAADVAEMSAAQVARINALLAQADEEVTARFEQFLAGLRGNLNDSITRDDAVSMLSQHLITAPVFDALFGGSGFAQSNPVSIGMQAMLDVLEGQGLEAETKHLERFYRSVRTRAAAVTDAAGRQTVIHDLYEKFFKNAFPKQAESLGVVYTPVEVVDFILRAADELSRRHFGQGLSDEGVQVLDPFTGTGTFIVRLLESGIIAPEDLPRKYGATDAAHELWCNELMLLAYYIACVNIESTYESITGEQSYVPFPGATLTDTFQISETGDRADTSLLPANNERITRQLQTPIQVIVGNPPYSVGQGSANDNNANLRYPSLDGRIRDTYAARSSATNKNNLYDSYIRAYRWATDRLAERGIMAFVSNGGWLDGNTADGMRLSLAEEFSELWVFNLRGNQRTAGELSRKEGGKIFGSGSRNTVAIVLGVKKTANPPPPPPPPTIHYRDIGDFLSREEKLALLAEATLDDEGWEQITPNAHGDWLNQRDDLFSSFMPIGSKSGEPAIFKLHSRGLATSRDTWCYNFSQPGLEDNMSRMIAAYNACLGAEADSDPSRISWSRGLLKDHQRGVRHSFDPAALRLSSYRPFTKQHSYFSRSMNDMVYRMHSIFPAPDVPNIGFQVISPHAQAHFSVLAAEDLVDCATFVITSQFFPRWTYEPGPKRAESEMLFNLDADLVGGYRRIDNITDEALAHFQQAFGAVTKDDIFAYVYAVLHSPQYRERFAADLRKMLPRIPLAASGDDFHAFAATGQELLELHIGYEEVDPYPLEETISARAGLDAYELFAVTTTKMKFASKTDRSTLIYNSHVRLGGIPGEVFAYQLGSRSALEWVMDRYVVKTDKSSGIVNDPNDWCREQRNPRYVIDLLKRVVTLSLETNRIIGQLPSLALEGR